MDNLRRTSLVNRICAGGYYVQIADDLYFLDFCLDIRFKTYLDYIYQKNYRIAVNRGLITKEDRLKELVVQKKWSNKNEYLIEKYKKDLEEFKKEYYKSIYNNKKKGKIKKEHDDTKKSLLKLLSEKHNLLSEGTCENYCLEVINRCKYSKIVKLNGECLSEDAFLSRTFVSDIEYSIYESSLGEEEVREIARTNPWRLYWNASSNSPSDIFGKSLSELSDEQQELCYWSAYYDNVYEAYERPNNDIVEDNMALDGWFLVKAEERERETAKKTITDKAGENREIFVITDAENANKIYEMNDPQVRTAMKKRNKILKETSVASEEELVKKGGIGSAGLFVGTNKKGK